MADALLASNPHQDEHLTIIAAALACTTVALLTLMARLYTRLVVVHSFGWDVSQTNPCLSMYFFESKLTKHLQDSFMCGAMLLSISIAILIILEAYNGGGRHVGDVSTEVYEMGMKINIITEPICVIAVTAVKLLIGMALLRIAGHTAWKYLIGTIMTVMGCWGFSSVFVSFICPELDDKDYN